MAVDPKAQSGDSIVTGNDDAGSATGAGKADALEREPNAVRRFFKSLGPGLVTGASDDDPSGIGTYAVAGAQLGYSSLWTALVTFPMMSAVQYICAKIGLVSGQGIATVLHEHYSRKLVYAVVLG